MALTTIFATQPTGNVAASTLDVNFNEVAAMGITQCTASGTNSINLTPLSNQPAVTAYQNYQNFGFVAAASSTGSVTINVSGLGAIGLYWDDGTQVSTSGLISAVYYQITYNSALNSGGGGFCFSAAIGSQGQIKGTGTNDNAAAGMINEYVISTIQSASAVSLSTGVSKNITSISIPSGGDWLIGGKGGFVSGTGTITTLGAVDMNLTSAAAFSADTAIVHIGSSTTITNGGVVTFALDERRVSLASGTNYFLNAIANFSVNTLSAYGIIWARRAR